MSETLLKNVQEMLNEEKWTRATLSNYTTAQFKELDTILKESRDLRLDNEIKNLCNEHLANTKNSIIALYLGGMTSLSQQIIDDSAMVSLLNIFVDNHKWGIVKFLCERMLDYGESKFALRTLSECYKNEDDQESVFAVWERLVKVDYEEADLTKALAENFEKKYEESQKKDDLENTVDYYKRALHRYIAKLQFNNVKEIWDKLLLLCPEDIDFFLHVQKRIAKNFDELKAGTLLKEVYDVCIQREDINTAINVLKLVLDYDNDDRHARKEITDCYRMKYADHSQLETYIRISSLAQGPRNVKEAVQDFEKHIAFDRGNFVHHRTWGVGRINKVQGDDIIIDFARQRAHGMSLKMAVNALQTLSKDHIWVLKATLKKEALHEKVKKDIPWALKTVIQSFGNSCDFKKIKLELVPSALSEEEWRNWGPRARDVLKTDPSFGFSPENADVYTVRERPISVDEKLYNEFKGAKNYSERAKIIRSYTLEKNAEFDSEFFVEMFAYFTGFIKSYNVINEQVITSFLLIKELVGIHPHLGTGLSLNFRELFEGIDNVSGVFQNIKDTRLRDDFLRHIRLFIPDWANIYLELFPRFPIESIVLYLEREGFEDNLVSLTHTCFDNYREYRESTVWLYRNAADKKWYKNANIPFEKQLITLIHILDITYRDIENRRDTAENRKINKTVYTILFSEALLMNYVDTSDAETLSRIYTFINDVKDLDPADKMELRNRIAKKYPDFKFFGEEEKKITTLGLIVTLAKLQEKQKQLAHIIEVDIPANSKEIETAKQHGDLKENAEYHAAREKQTQLNSLASRLNGEIDRAQIFDPSHISTSKVSFGTKVTLLNKNMDKQEEFTILGPWESDPDNKIISYLSPFGNSIYGKAVGEEIFFTSNEETSNYLVVDISSAL